MLTPMSVQAELLLEIETFLAQRGGMAETTFGRLAVNDGKFVARLREGCNMTLATIERTRNFIKDQRIARGIDPLPALKHGSSAALKSVRKRRAKAPAAAVQARRKTAARSTPAPSEGAE